MTVTIADGAFADGTTMQVSYMRLRLESWYGHQDERERVALMYAPQVTPEQVEHFTTDAAGDPALLTRRSAAMASSDMRRPRRVRAATASR